MFWNKFDSLLNKESSVQELLAKTEPESVTLKEIFDKEDTIQLTKARNVQLVKVLCRPDILRELVSLITHETVEETEMKNRFKDATLACEIINADVPEITEALVGESGAYLDMLLGLFADNSSEQLNPILTSFVSRTLGLLIARRPNEVFEYLQRTNNLLDITLKHLNITAVTDLYIRLITSHENDGFRYQMCEWLNRQHLLERVATYLDSSTATESDFHLNASQLICDVIRFSREQQLQQLKPDDQLAALTPETYANDLLKTADSDEFISSILEILLRNTEHQSSIVHCLAVLGAPFDFIPVNFEGNPEQKALFQELGCRVVNSRIEKYTRILQPVLPRLHQIIRSPPLRNTLISELVEDGYGSKERVGQARLQLVRMMALLISFGRQQLNRAIYDEQLLITLLELFFHFHWNSFLHLHVQNCINLIVRNSPLSETSPVNPLQDHPLLHQMMVNGRLLQRIMEAWKDNERLEESGKPRRSYMGHLSAIAMEFSPEMVSKNPMLQATFNDLGETRKEWDAFFDSTIKSIMEKQARCLAGIHPMQTQNQPPAISPHDSEVASFEYAARTPVEKETGFVTKHIDQLPPQIAAEVEKHEKEKQLHPDDEMRTYDDDVDMEDRVDVLRFLPRHADRDTSMITDLFGSSTPTTFVAPNQRVQRAEWPETQPLHVNEKRGLERMEEAENSNSPWDVVMQGNCSDSVDFWASGSATKSGDVDDTWADFSAFESAPPTGMDFFHTSPVHQVNSNNSVDSEDGAPFEFRASCLTPEPGESPVLLDEHNSDESMNAAVLSSNQDTRDSQRAAGDTSQAPPSKLPEQSEKLA